MGQVYADITLKNAGDVTLVQYGYKQEHEIRVKTMSILVDTGAITLIINDDIRQELGLNLRENQSARLADNTRITVQIADPVEISWKNRKMTCQPWVIPHAEMPLLGLIPLENMDLMVDPVNRKLVGVHGEEQVGIIFEFLPPR